MTVADAAWLVHAIAGFGKLIPVLNALIALFPVAPAPATVTVPPVLGIELADNEPRYWAGFVDDCCSVTGLPCGGVAVTVPGFRATTVAGDPRLIFELVCVTTQLLGVTPPVMEPAVEETCWNVAVTPSVTVPDAEVCWPIEMMLVLAVAEPKRAESCDPVTPVEDSTQAPPPSIYGSVEVLLTALLPSLRWVTIVSGTKQPLVTPAGSVNPRT